MLQNELLKPFSMQQENNENERLANVDGQGNDRWAQNLFQIV